MTTWTDNWEATVGAGRPIRSPFEGSRGETMLASLSQVMTIEWKEEKDSGSIWEMYYHVFLVLNKQTSLRIK